MSAVAERHVRLFKNGKNQAPHARSLGLIAVTDNTREFERVPDLAVENWLLLPPSPL